MEDKKRNIDQILLNKAYDKLSAEEFLIVKKEFNSEKEYTELRAMLLAATNELASAEEIEPKSSTKDVLMKEFTRVHPAMGSSAGGLGFLFPKGRAFYQQPGYQLLAVAAVLVLIFTIYPKLTGNMTSDKEVAQHNVEPPKMDKAEKKENKIAETPVEEKSEIEATEKDLMKENMQTVDQTLAGTTEEQKPEINNGYTNFKTADEGGAKDKSFASDGLVGADDELATVQEKPMYAPAVADDEADNIDYWDNSNTDETALATESATTGSYDYNANENTSGNNEGGNTLDLDANAGAVAQNEIALAEEEETIDNVSVLEASKNSQKYRNNKKSDATDIPVKKVKSLSENAELIDLFYTAM